MFMDGFETLNNAYCLHANLRDIQKLPAGNIPKTMLARPFRSTVD